MSWIKKLGRKILGMIRRLFTPVEDFKLGDLNVPSSSSDPYSKNLDRIDSLFSFLHDKPEKKTELKSQNSDETTASSPTQMTGGKVAVPNQDEIRKKHSKEFSSINTTLDANKAMEDPDRSAVKRRNQGENQRSRKSTL
jgi:hypothetical protein